MGVPASFSHCYYFLDFLVFIPNVFSDFWKRKSEFEEYPKMGCDKDDVLLFFILLFVLLFVLFDFIGLTLYSYFF